MFGWWYLLSWCWLGRGHPAFPVIAMKKCVCFVIHSRRGLPPPNRVCYAMLPEFLRYALFSLIRLLMANEFSAIICSNGIWFNVQLDSLLITQADFTCYLCVYVCVLTTSCVGTLPANIYKVVCFGTHDKNIPMGRIKSLISIRPIPKPTFSIPYSCCDNHQ